MQKDYQIWGQTLHMMLVEVLADGRRHEYELVRLRDENASIYKGAYI